MHIAEAIFAHASPVRESQPWNRALTWSGGAHLSLIAFLLLMKMNQTPFPTAILTEVHLVERPVMAAKAAPEPVKPATAVAPALTKGTSPDSQMLKSKVEMNATGAAPLATGHTDASGEKASPVAGSIAPLSGPIVTSDTLGFVGRKTGALVELSNRSGGATGANAMPTMKGSAKTADPIALGKMGVDELRNRESSIGAPLVSEKVLTGGVGAIGGKGLAASTEAEKRRAALESLKANPLDDDKWGKNKGPFSMEGPLKYRKIVKMELPPYPRWAEEKAIEASVSIRLWVDARGKVKDNMYLEKTSGYSELDHVAMEALKAFVFVPIPTEGSQEDEWGVATFKFELKH